VLLNACKDIGLAVNTGNTNYMKIRCNRGMIPNEHVRIGSSFYERVKTYKYLFIDKSKFYITRSQENNLNVNFPRHKL